LLSLDIYNMLQHTPQSTTSDEQTPYSNEDVRN
jgi:hypothetical protein